MVLEAIGYVLWPDCPWKALPKARSGSASAVLTRFLPWEKAGFFKRSGQPGRRSRRRWQALPDVGNAATVRRGKYRRPPEQIGRKPPDQGKGGKRHLLAPGYLLQASEPGVVRSNGVELVPALS